MSRGTAGEQGRLGAAFLVALTLHVGALGAMVLWTSRDVQNPPGEQEITIDLAPAMEFAEAVAAVEATAPAQALTEPIEAQPPEPITAAPPPPEETTEVVEMAEALPPDAAEVVPSQDLVEAVPADAAPVEAPAADEPDVVAAVPPPEETVVAKAVEEKPAPKRVRPPAPKKVERKPPPRRDVAEQRPVPSTPRQGQASSSRENTGGAAASADPNVLNRYVAQLAAALRSRLRYPETARAQGLEGVATIRFTMQRSGQIVSASLVRSTGNPSLDQAALAAASPGTSLPAAPETMPQQQLTVSVPLRFNLR
ncbi:MULTISPECIES: energy transducer TonB family protein [Microvirga]|uniref:TonB family protein n=2 Tax=Microvirga TaxID=186650 RepID=A0ABW9Z4J7_9HYPH|nr:energy transducer TonB [Microvirga arsenatis]NBJ13870.1 TonB family protein [Microvirga arsenatis]NBJ27313.1 TonB family protein [Microvirga arsenatis]